MQKAQWQGGNCLQCSILFANQLHTKLSQSIQLQHFMEKMFNAKMTLSTPALDGQSSTITATHKQRQTGCCLPTPQNPQTWGCACNLRWIAARQKTVASLLEYNAMPLQYWQQRSCKHYAFCATLHAQSPQRDIVCDACNLETCGPFPSTKPFSSHWHIANPLLTSEYTMHGHTES